MLLVTFHDALKEQAKKRALDVEEAEEAEEKRQV